MAETPGPRRGAGRATEVAGRDTDEISVVPAEIED
jgi:hypothetical protein